MEKLEYTISFKVPARMKLEYDHLTKEQKKVLHHTLRVKTAEALHMAKLNLRDYLEDEV